MLNVTTASLGAKINSNVVSFKAKNVGDVKDMSYKNVLAEPLKSTPNADFGEKLKKIPGVKSLENAKTRVASLSRYLKEDMVGFVIPEYTFNGVTKGGDQWFQKGSEYLLRGCKQGANEKDFPALAKDLYGMLATHDNYWKSDKFHGYLSTLEETPAIKATKDAVKDLQKQDKQVSFKGLVQMYGYFSPLKAMDKLLNDGCAYSGKKLQFDDPTKKRDGKIPPDVNASLEHIMPKSWGGPCEDYNYLLTSQGSNSKRGNMDLLSYLKGNTAKPERGGRR